jgi:hypothetical protein
MSNRLSWGWDTTQTVTGFTLTKSTNKGISFSALVTIPFDTVGANYDAREKKFFYVDNTGVPGDVYKVVAHGTFGVSTPAIIVAPPAAALTCTIIGYVLDLFGSVDERMRVIVDAYGSRGERWMQNPVGVVAQHPEAVAARVTSRVFTLDSAGMWQADLVRGSYARVQIPELQFTHVFEVPQEAGPVNIRDIPQLRGPELALFGESNGDKLYLPEY